MEDAVCAMKVGVGVLRLKQLLQFFQPLCSGQSLISGSLLAVWRTVPVLPASHKLCQAASARNKARLQGGDKAGVPEGLNPGHA